MKVIAKFDDGQAREIIISDPIAMGLCSLTDAVKLAKMRFSAEELAHITNWEIEEEFL